MATFTVSTKATSGAGSLADAIAQAEATAEADTITFAVSGRYLTTDTFTLTTDITFDGDVDGDGDLDVAIFGGPEETAVGDHMIFRIEPGAEVVFDTIALARGAGRGSGLPAAGAILNFGTVTILDSEIVGNSAEGFDASDGAAPGADGADGGDAAGGIYNAGTLVASSTIFGSNTATGGAGGIGSRGSSGETPGGKAFGPGGGGGDGGDGGYAAGDILNAPGAIMSLSFVTFSGKSSVTRGQNGGGGNGGDGTTGGDGGDSGRIGTAGASFLNLGDVSGSFEQNSDGDFVVTLFQMPAGKGGQGTVSDGHDGTLDLGGFDSVGALTYRESGGGTIKGLDGDDVIALEGDAPYTVSGERGDDVIFNQGSGASTLDGSGGDDRLFGSPNANDTFKVSLGADRYIGDKGIDTIDFGNIAGPVIIDLGKSEVQPIFAGSVTLNLDVENIIGTAKADALTGTAGANILDGGGGKDTLAGLAGDDRYIVNDAAAVIVEAAGEGTADRVLARSSFALSGDDDIEFLTTSSSAGTKAIELTGNARSQEIVGNAGANVLDDGGKGAADVLRGLGGNDIYRVNNAADVIEETASQGAADIVNAAVSYVLGAGVHVETLRTNSGAATTAINLTGNALKQAITGNAGANLLNSGGAGASDTLRGLGGSDTYRVHNTGDTIVEVAGQGADKAITSTSYALGSGVSVEVLQTNLSAGTSAINLYGNEIAQEIIGNAGANRIDGKGGADTLRGLGGADTFVFGTKLGGGNTDTIVDFNPAADRLLLSDAIFTALAPGTITATAFRANTTGEARDATDRIVYDTDSGGIFYDADGLGGAAGVRFAIVSTGLSITNADFDVA